MTAEAARLLWAAWQAHTQLERLPAGLHPESVADGYAVQDAVAALNGLPQRGWKIGATNAAARAVINISEPVSGRLYAPFFHDSPAELSADAFAMRALEPEVAFTLAADLPPRSQPYSEDEVAEAVATTHPALEIPDTRWTAWTKIGAPGFVADNSVAGAFVLGPPATFPGEVSARLVVNGRVIAEGSSRDVMGSPIRALAWLANHLLERGLQLRAGDVVTTGSCTSIGYAEKGDHVIADFGTFGRAEAHFV